MKDSQDDIMKTPVYELPDDKGGLHVKNQRELDRWLKKAEKQQVSNEPIPADVALALVKRMDALERRIKKLESTVDGLMVQNRKLWAFKMEQERKGRDATGEGDLCCDGI